MGVLFRCLFEGLAWTDSIILFRLITTPCLFSYLQPNINQTRLMLQLITLTNITKKKSTCHIPIPIPIPSDKKHFIRSIRKILTKLFTDIVVCFNSISSSCQLAAQLPVSLPFHYLRKMSLRNDKQLVETNRKSNHNDRQSTHRIFRELYQYIYNTS